MVYSTESNASLAADGMQVYYKTISLILQSLFYGMLFYESYYAVLI